MVMFYAYFCCSSNKILGYREKIFAIIGVKVYAAGLYVNDSVFSSLDAWRGRSAADIQQDPSLFNKIFEGESAMLNCLTGEMGRRSYHLSDAKNDSMNCSGFGEIFTYCAGQRC